MKDTQIQPQLRLDHAAIWVEDMEKTVSFLTDVVGWRRHPMEIMVSAEDETTGGMEAVFVDANGLWLEMILPTSPGPGMDILNEKGDGAIIEINFEPDDYDAVLQDMKAKGIPMFNMDGSPLGEDGGLIKEGVVDEGDFEHTGQRIAYWSTEQSRGTTVEIFEVLRDDAVNLINQRDTQWQKEALSQQGPRMSPHFRSRCGPGEFGRFLYRCNGTEAASHEPGHRRQLQRSDWRHGGRVYRCRRRLAGVVPACGSRPAHGPSERKRRRLHRGIVY